MHLPPPPHLLRSGERRGDGLRLSPMASRGGLLAQVEAEGLIAPACAHCVPARPWMGKWGTIGEVPALAARSRGDNLLAGGCCAALKKCSLWTV